MLTIDKIKKEIEKLSEKDYPNLINWFNNQTRNFHAKEILSSYIGVQFVGCFGIVVGALFWFIIQENTNLMKIFFTILPILLAFGLAGILFLISEFIKENDIKLALLAIFGTLLLDVGLLAWFINETGGGVKSPFVPFFLLIPTVATFYLKGRWLFIIITIIIIIFSLVCITNCKVNTHDSTNIIPESLMYTLSTISCIITAIVCWWKVKRITKGYCLIHSIHCEDLKI